MSVHNMWGDRCTRSKGKGMCIYTHWSSLMSQPSCLLAQVGLLICMGYLSCDKWLVYLENMRAGFPQNGSIDLFKKIRVHKWEPPEESWDLLPISKKCWLHLYYYKINDQQSYIISGIKHSVGKYSTIGWCDAAWYEENISECPCSMSQNVFLPFIPQQLAKFYMY